MTVLFTDFVGSTTAQEEMDPEAVRTENQRAYERLRATIERYGGTVVKFVGDGMMAAFGVPEVSEDDAARALAAAVELRTDFGGGVRIGVNTGEVVVAPDDRDVMGDTVNVASRLEQAAPRGGILVGESTYRLARGVATFEPPVALQVKGRAQPVETRVLRDLQDASSTTPAALVGRETELALLLTALRAAEATRRPCLVTLIGSPGIGKSRLLAELEQAVSGVATVLTGRCAAAGMASLEPIAEVLRCALGAAGGFTGLSLDAAERARVETVVDALLGAGHPGTPQETVWAVRRVVEALARSTPVLIILDDLHWADPMVLDVVEHLAEWLVDVPVLLVAAGRPELRELRPALVEIGARPTHVLSLEGLDAGATGALAAELLGAGGIPPAVVDRIVRTTGGNPLFVRELLRMLVEDGVLRANDGANDGGWSLTVDPEDVQVPETINALLAARIERLPADERAVLERASVLGQDVVRGALADLVPVTVRTRLPTILETLRHKELLEPAGAYWIDEPLLRFHHVLVRDAAYRRVLKSARAELHERVARWIVTKADAEEHDELVGYHLEQSDLSRRDLGALDEHGLAVAAEAGTTLGRAARRALQRDQLSAAAAHVGRALQCLPLDHAERPELLLVACEAFLETGDIGSARDAIGELGEMAGDARLAAWRAAFTVQLGTLVGSIDLADGEHGAAAAATTLTELGDAAGAAKCHRVRAAVLARAGRIGDSESALDEALTATRQADDRRQITRVLAAAPLAALWGPSPVTRAGGRCLDVIRLLHITSGAREVEAIPIRCQAVLEALRGRPGAARAMLERAREILEDLGSRHGLLDLELFAGIVELVSGRPDAADERLAGAEAGFRHMGLHADAARATALRARAAAALGDDDAALTLAATAAKADGSDLTTSVTWRGVRAEVLARRGRIEEATAIAGAAVALADQTDALLDHAGALTSLAAVLTEAGDLPAASAAREQAWALYERKGATAFGAARAAAEPETQAGAARSTVTPNRAAVQARRDYALMQAGQWDDMRASHSPAFVFEARRALVISDERDLGTTLDGAKSVFEQGYVLQSFDVVATRGDNLALVQVALGDDRFADEWLQIQQVDHDGLTVAAATYDLEDLDVAMAELDRLAPRGRVESPTLATLQIELLRDFSDEGRIDDLRRAMHPEFILDDRRHVPRGRSPDNRSTDALATVVDVLSFRMADTVATRGELLALFRLRTQEDQIGEQSLLVMQVDPFGRGLRAVVFDSDATDAALAELDRLGEFVGVAPHPPVPPNRAVLITGIAITHIEEERWDYFYATMRPDYEFDDRRPVGAGRVVGRDAVIELPRAMRAVGVRHLRNDAVATRGDALALLRQSMANDEFEDEWLGVVHLDDRGVGVRVVLFGADELDAAIAELDYLAGEDAADGGGAVHPARSSVRRQAN